jgi:hypothetical protein
MDEVDGGDDIGSSEPITAAAEAGGRAAAESGARGAEAAGARGAEAAGARPAAATCCEQRRRERAFFRSRSILISSGMGSGAILSLSFSLNHQNPVK